ncbi:MAG: hypothetical protein EOO42_10565 [Flavobacteriales bacterium]|nr:MAG: hypothetical protein EOO42_10565 [Flavobacteriales bacterium]
MFKAENHIKNIRYIVLMWFILFSLSPCTVKEVLLYSLNTEYAEPLNKSKTVQTNPCQYSSNEYQQKSAAQQSKINQKIEPVDFVGNYGFPTYVAKIDKNYSKTSTGNSPPKYILYKRLKINIA